jgi:DNA-directed RNA polymerase subunit alpha
LRRLILAYNVGGAITGVQIKGVPHEYYVIDGVKESVIDMLLNLKKLRFKVDEGMENIQWVSQRISGIGKYDSSCLKLPTGIELLDDSVYLFEVSDPSLELNIELRIEK